MAFQIDIRKIGHAIKTEPVNIIRLFNPYGYSKFFETMEFHSRNYILSYLLFIGLFTLVGYYLNISVYAEITCSSIDAFKSAFLYYITFVSVPLITGFSFHIFGKGLVGREISKEEGISLIAYASTPLIISGIFRTIPETMILHYICVMYSVYLLYSAIRVRYGFERSLATFAFLMIIVFISSMIIIGSGSIIVPPYCF